LANCSMSLDFSFYFTFVLFCLIPPVLFYAFVWHAAFSNLRDPVHFCRYVHIRHLSSPEAHWKLLFRILDQICCPVGAPFFRRVCIRHLSGPPLFPPPSLLLAFENSFLFLFLLFRSSFLIKSIKGVCDGVLFPPALLPHTSQSTYQHNHVSTHQGLSCTILFQILPSPCYASPFERMNKSMNFFKNNS